VLVMAAGAVVRGRVRDIALAMGLILLLGAGGMFLVRYRVYSVPVTTMEPAIRAGQSIVVDTWSQDTVKDDIVLVDEDGTPVVKRVAGRYDKDRLFLLDDNAAGSADTETVEESAVTGRIVSLVNPPRSFSDRAVGALHATVAAGIAGVAFLLVSGLLALITRSRKSGPEPDPALGAGPEPDPALGAGPEPGPARDSGPASGTDHVAGEPAQK
jgi:hypothetical protein